MAGGKITRITLGSSSTDIEGNFEGFYKNLNMTAGKENRFNAKSTNHGNPKDAPKAGKFFIKGWWTNHKDEPIKRAIYGQLLRFHIEMDKTHTRPGDIVYFGLYDSDMHSFGNDIKKADDPIPLEHKDGSKRAYTWEKVNNENKVIIEFSTTDSLEQWTNKLDEDKIFELYFRCSYVNRGNTEHRELPYNFHDYLDLGAIVIDRYKMPGLNPQGDGIAEDMAYGTGFPSEENKTTKRVYSETDIAQYKEEYKIFGFDFSKHALFADAEDDILMEPMEIEEVIISNKKEEEKYKQPKDNATIYRPKFPTPTEQRNALIRVRNKNVKAIYTRNEISQLGTLMNLTSQSDDENSLWFDFRLMTQGLLSRGRLNDNISSMITRMRANTGGIFENNDLTAAILENPATLEYLQKVEDYIAEQLKTKFNKLEEVEDKEPYFKTDQDVYSNSKGSREKNKKNNFKSPAYTYKRNWNVLRGETIALNDIWATEIILKEVKLNGENYAAKYEVTLWDHFGLDKPDMEKFYSYGAGFRAWFVLQHLWGYKPFLTKMQFTRELNGNINVGSSERNAQREQEQKEREEMNREIIQEVLRGPKI